MGSFGQANFGLRQITQTIPEMKSSMSILLADFNEAAAKLADAANALSQKVTIDRVVAYANAIEYLKVITEAVADEAKKCVENV